jgi:hypothetical protein
MRNTLIALLFSATFAASAMPTAVERGVVVEGGLQFHKTIVLNTAAFCDGSVRLEKGTYDVKFESLGNNKVRATFFTGGVRKGEANGIIIVGGSTQAIGGGTGTGPGPGPGPGPGGKNAFSFEDLGLHPSSAHALQQQGGKLNLVVNGQGTNQILIGLLLPAVQKGGIIGPSDLGAQKVQPAGK